MQRRQFLGGTAAVGGAALLAGADGADADVDVQPADGPRTPSVPMAESDGWAVDEDRTETFSNSGMGITSRGSTVAYVDEGLADELREKTQGADFEDLRLFFASRIEYAPSVDRLPFGVGRDVVVNRTESSARDRFESRLEDAGVESIERRETRRIDVEDGPTTDLLLYDAVYPYEGFEFEAGDTVVSAGGTPIDVEGMLAVWYDRESRSTLVAGAVNPAENYEETIERRITDAVDLTLDVDLGLTPERYREESLELVRSVS